MATLAELINMVADDLNRTDLTAKCSDAVVMAIRHYDARPWWFSQGSATFTTTATTSAYPLASDFRKMDYVEARYPGDNWQEITQTDFSTLRRKLEGVTVTGYPDEYAIYDQALHLGYAPNDAYIVRYFYQKTLTDLTADASNTWTTDCKDLIRAAAAKTVALRTLHDPELANLQATVENSELMSLTAENDQRTTTGKAKPQY